MGAPQHDRTLTAALAMSEPDVPGPDLPASRALAILEGIGEAIVVLDRRFRVSWWNAAAERMSGVRREDVLGEVFWERFPSLAGTPFERRLRDSMATGQPREFRGWRYDGAHDGRGAGTYDARTWPLESGELVLLFTDVAAREAQKRELEARNRENEALREFARAMVAEADSRALLRLLCQATLKELGGHSALVVRQLGNGQGECLAAAGPGTALEGAVFPLAGSLVGRVLQSNAPVNLEQYSSESAYFRAIAEDTRLGPITVVPLMAHKEQLGALSLAREVGRPPFTEADRARLSVFVDLASLAAWKARLLERAEEANEAKSNFLATMSHELRTPLTALTGYGELLADDIFGPLGGPQRDIVDRMRSVTHHLAAMIDELLTYSSLEAGREYARIRTVRIADVVEEASVVIEPLARGKGIAYTVAIAPGLPALRTDADKVRQILVNLLGNGVKFTEAGGAVRLEVVDADDAVRFVATDTGIGISRDQLARLFQPFVQLDTGLTRRHGGTGLGLYISGRLAALLGGRIDVRSEPGQGSAFTLVLPKQP